MLILILFCICVCLLLCVFIIAKRRTTDPPYLSGRLPILGHLHRFLLEDTLELIKSMGVDTTKNGGSSTLDLGFRKMIVVTDPEDCLTVANTSLEKELVYSFGKCLFGRGLLLSNVSTWKKHRKLLNPAFSQAVLNTFVKTFNNQARILVQCLADDLGRPIDHENLLRINNLDTICLTVMGVNRKEDGDLNKQFIELMSGVLRIFSKRLQQFWLQSNFIFSIMRYKREQDEIISNMTNLSNQIIEAKKSKLSNGSKTGCANNESGHMKPFMDLILDLADETGCFTDEDIRQQTTTIIAAGHDTSASILTFVFTLLGTYPDIQDKVYREVQEVIGDSNKDVDKDDLSKLVYTEAVLKETLRLYPVTPLLGRFTEKPVKLRNFTIEANTGVFIVVYELHRHSMWGPDVDQFRPERWLEPDKLPDLNYFGSFGLGRRGCIGKVYAMMSMKVVVAHVVRQYRISGDVTKMHLIWDMMSRPQGTGHHVTLQLRNQ